ncbi:CpaD family pilus assembly protein [Brevundimonas sp. SL130]|uniref:CpaD family pilus assembly protein n=1 Tax=Brevundimonas sp. SL130 TaxID=2995143 RepID=UPI00226CEF34|nr:CpaD family pilus assembly lipoprotein [Brevundimonas sp. SL130]WAC60488.1 CpaD family pilus assembly lipoprotein [Brevundimonas sp. SL130]
MIRFAAVAAVSALLSACAATGSTGAPPLTSTSRYVLQVEPGVDRIALAVHADGLSTTQQAALADLAVRFAQARADIIRIETPTGDDPVAHQVAWNTRDALIARGVPAERLRVVSYEAPAARAPILAGFETVQAFIPNCAAAQSVMRSSFSNQPSSAFGCAVTANLAAQIANPRDIVAPADLAPSDMGRRGKVFDTYRGGVKTSAPQEPLIDGEISKAVD